MLVLVLEQWLMMFFKKLENTFRTKTHNTNPNRSDGAHNEHQANTIATTTAEQKRANTQLKQQQQQLQRQHNRQLST